MAKKSRDKSTPTRSEQDSETKRQKKQAKKEAKMMLAIEQVKDSLEKAQDKLASAQSRVEARAAHLRNLEAKLAAYRTSSQQAQAETPDSGLDQQGQPNPQELPAALNASTNSPDESNHTGAAHEENGASPASSTQETADEPATSDSPAEAPATSDQQSEQSGEPSPAATVAKRTGVRSLRSRITRRASTASNKPDTSPAPARRAAARGRTNTNKTTARATNRDAGA